MGKAKLLAFFSFFRFLVGICPFLTAFGACMEGRQYKLN